jgi:hypothetical protein
MPAKAKVSKSFREKQRRLKALPKLGQECLYGMRKKDAATLIKIFHDGIKKRNLGLKRLSKTTIAQKRSKGYDLPDVPLYGAGDSESPKSYSSMLRMRKLKNGWKVQGSIAKHHEADITLRRLLDIHEHGRTFVVKNKKTGETRLIRIPPRPAFAKSVSKLYKKLKAEKQYAEMKKEFTKFVNTGKSKFIDYYIDIYKNKHEELVEKK